MRLYNIVICSKIRNICSRQRSNKILFNRSPEISIVIFRPPGSRVFWMTHPSTWSSESKILTRTKEVIWKSRVSVRILRWTNGRMKEGGREKDSRRGHVCVSVSVRVRVCVVCMHVCAYRPELTSFRP